MTTRNIDAALLPRVRGGLGRFAVALVAALVGAGCSSPDPAPSAVPTTLDPTVATSIAPTVPAAPAKDDAPQTSAGGVSVRTTGARGDGTGDDTAAFLRAQDAALAGSFRYPKGPGGGPQAVVQVPAGTYRLLRLAFRSDIRMEIDAGAVLMQAGGRNVDVTNVPALIFWDGPPGEAVKNVTVTGVGTSTGGRKSAAEPVQPGWSVAGSFTFDLDPQTTNANEAVAGIQAVNVDGFLIENVFSIQNDSQPTVAPTEKEGWWPQSRKAALGLRGSNRTPLDGSVHYDPHNGTVTNWYNIGSPKGFGPNQVNAGHNLTFRRIFTQGGTALRLETDASQGKDFASELRGVRAEEIVGRNCNRAVSFAPHAQVNTDVAVSNVQAIGCFQGVVESIDESNNQKAGAFKNSTITNVSVVGGDNAQVTRPNSGGMWVAGRSEKAFAKDKPNQATWSVLYVMPYTCSESFSDRPDPIMTAEGLKRPTCRYP